MNFKLPELSYAYNALEPFFDEETMRLHHDKHHAIYTANFNAALEKYPELAKKTPEKILSNLEIIPSKIRTLVRNNGGGYVNHSFFWEILAPNQGGNPKYEVGDAISESFGNFERFKEIFKKKAIGHFGSGWVWVVVENGELKITSTSNQDSPLSLGQTPILTLDLWEHAYYLKYHNVRLDYIEAFWHLIHWKKVNKFYVEAK